MEFTVIDADLDALQKAYGAGAETILDQMSFQVSRVTGSEPEAWCYRVYANGLLVPAPLDSSAKDLADAQLHQIFRKAVARSIEALHLATHGGELPDELATAIMRAEALCSPQPIC